MSKTKMVCPFFYAGKSGEEIDDDIFCIGSDCALWVDDMDDREDFGCCGLACAGMAYNMQPTLYRDPAVGGEEE